MAHTTKTAYPYYVNPVTNEAWVFSALDNDCIKIDSQRALDAEIITEEYRNALLANVYSGATKPKTEYWLQLTP